MSGFGIKDCLTEASLGWKYFGTLNKDREFHILTVNMLEFFLPKSMKAGRVAAFERYF